MAQVDLRAARLDVIAELRQQIFNDRANVLSRIQAYLTSIGSDQGKDYKALSEEYTSNFYDTDYGLILRDFTYQTKDPVFTPDEVTERVFENDGSVEAQEEFSFTTSLEESFTFGFTEGLKVGAKATATVKIPLVGEGETELSAEVSFDANQQWTKTKLKTWSLTETIHIPAHSNVRITGYVQNAALSADFSGVVKATQGLVLVEIELTDNRGYTSAPFPLTVLLTEEQRTFPVRGTFQGAEGVSAYTKVQQIDKATAAAAPRVFRVVKSHSKN